MKDSELDYKNYSLEKLGEFIQDALQTEATPTEIYDTIVNTLKKEIKYHDVCKKQAEDVLDRIGGHRDFSFMTYGLDEYPYGESILSASDDTISLSEDTISFKTENDDVITFPKSFQ